MGEFMHNSLVKAGSRGAVENMLTGAAVGAVANVGLGMTQGDFGVVGNATSGGMMGAIGGAGARHFGAQYVDGLRSVAKKGEYTNKFKTSMFTEATKMDEKARQDFMGTNDHFGKFDHEKYGKTADFIDKHKSGFTAYEGSPYKGSPLVNPNTPSSSIKNKSQVKGKTPKKGQPEGRQTATTPNQTSGRINVEEEPGRLSKIGGKVKNFFKDAYAEQKEAWKTPAPLNTDVSSFIGNGERTIASDAQNALTAQKKAQREVDNRNTINMMRKDNYRNTMSVGKPNLKVKSEGINVAEMFKASPQTRYSFGEE